MVSNVSAAVTHEPTTAASTKFFATFVTAAAVVPV
jgi:hypothetical protein